MKFKAEEFPPKVQLLSAVLELLLLLLEVLAGRTDPGPCGFLGTDPSPPGKVLALGLLLWRP